MKNLSVNLPGKEKLRKLVYGTLVEEGLATMLLLILAPDAKTRPALPVVMPVTGADSSAVSAVPLSDSTESSTYFLLYIFG